MGVVAKGLSTRFRFPFPSEALGVRNLLGSHFKRNELSACDALFIAIDSREVEPHVCKNIVLRNTVPI